MSSQTVTPLEPTHPKLFHHTSITRPITPAPSPFPPSQKNTKCSSSTLAYQERESSELGEYVANDVALLNSLGWEAFVKSKRGRGDIGQLNKPHPANRLLKHYKHHGAPVRFSTPPWSLDRLLAAVKRGPHQSCNLHLNFLQQEFIDMIQKGQWVVLPFSVAKNFARPASKPSWSC